MKITKTISYMLYAAGIIAFALASGARETLDWFAVAKPYFVAGAICIIVGLVIGNIYQIRRYTYPIFTCACAWAYKHKVTMTKFTRSAYRVYKYQHSSYKRLFNYTQGMFDMYLEALN